MSFYSSHVSTHKQGYADIVLYGNIEDMEEDTSTVDAGTKYLWAAAGGVVEIHGEDRKGWTHLDDHVWANSVPVEELEWTQGMDKKTLFFCIWFLV